MVDVLDGLVQAVDHQDRQDRRQVLGAPVLLGGDFGVDDCPGPLAATQFDAFFAAVRKGTARLSLLFGKRPSPNQPLTPVYEFAARARDRIGSLGLGVMLVLLVTIYGASLFGPPPPSVQAVAWSAQGLWLFVLFAWWVDRHRESRSLPPGRRAIPSVP